MRAKPGPPLHVAWGCSPDPRHCPEKTGAGLQGCRSEAGKREEPSPWPLTEAHLDPKSQIQQHLFSSRLTLVRTPSSPPTFTTSSPVPAPLPEGPHRHPQTSTHLAHMCVQRQLCTSVRTGSQKCTHKHPVLNAHTCTHTHPHHSCVPTHPYTCVLTNSAHGPVHTLTPLPPGTAPETRPIWLPHLQQQHAGPATPRLPSPHLLCPHPAPSTPHLWPHKCRSLLLGAPSQPCSPRPLCRGAPESHQTARPSRQGL